jgi:polyferredoxin
MVLALLAIIFFPSTLTLIRTTHKMLFFIFSQVLFFTIGIPLIGARSYCTHICPLGYEIGLIVQLKKRWKKQKSAGNVISSLVSK